MSNAVLIKMTTSSARMTTLSQAMPSKAKNSNGSMSSEKCSLCKKKIDVGANIITKKSSGYTKWYHKNCARTVNII